MKRIYKVLLTACLGLTLMLSSGQTHECRAQGYPTMDIQNFIQNVLGYIQDADVSGLFQQFSDIEMTTNKYMEWIKQFQQYIQVAQTIMNGVRYGLEIVRITEFFIKEGEYFFNCANYFAMIGASPYIIAAARNIWTDFMKFQQALLQDSETKLNFVKSLTSGDGLQILAAMDDMLKDYQKEFYEMDVHFRLEVNRLYTKVKRMQYATADGNFMNRVIFY